MHAHISRCADRDACRRKLPQAVRQESPAAALDSPRLSQGATQRDKAGGDHKLVRTDRCCPLPVSDMTCQVHQGCSASMQPDKTAAYHADVCLAGHSTPEARVCMPQCRPLAEGRGMWALVWWWH